MAIDNWPGRPCALRAVTVRTWPWRMRCRLSSARKSRHFAKPTFERLRRARHSAQYFDPSAAPLTESDATWAIEKAKEALSGVKELLAAAQPERFG